MDAAGGWMLVILWIARHDGDRKDAEHGSN